MSWLGVLLLCLGCYAEKLIGMSIPARWVTGRPLLARGLDLLPTALLAALVATSALLAGHHLQAGARLAGLGAAALLLLRRAPLIAVVVGGAGATALVRVLA
jgi:branched-subunit amino acid transport protein